MRFIEISRRRNTRVDSRILRGTASQEIIKQVQNENYDLLIKASHSTSAIRQLIFGQTDHELIHHCLCSLWIKKPVANQTHCRILAAVNPTPVDGESESHSASHQLNSLTIECASRLAVQFDAELHVACVWDSCHESSLRNRDGFDDDFIDEVEESLKRQQELTVARMLELDLQRISKVHSVSGDPAEGIGQLVELEGFSAVLMGLVPRAGIAGAILGNPAERILDQLNCSMMVVKAEDPLPT